MTVFTCQCSSKAQLLARFGFDVAGYYQLRLTVVLMLSHDFSNQHEL